MIITISRQMATNGEVIGSLVAEQLHLHYYDRELVDELARQLNTARNVVTRFDESMLNPIQSLLLEWRSNINEETYLRSLREALHHLQQQGNAVIIGRGANYVISGPDCVHVRIVAPMALRVAIFRAQHPEVADAERYLRHGDQERAHFIQHHFHQNIDDPGGYDLTLNLVGLTPEMVTEIIVHAAEMRASQPLAQEARATLPQHIAIMTRHRRPTPPPFIAGGEEAA